MSSYKEIGEDKSIYSFNNLEHGIVEMFDKKGPVGVAGFTSTFINLLKSIMGTGLLALPYTFNTLGPLLAIPLLVLCAYFSIVGLRIYSLCGMRAGFDSIGLVCRMIDWKLQIMIDVALLIMCIGTAVSYFSIIGDSIPILIKNNLFTINREISLLSSVIILLPIALIRNTNHLRYTSILGLAGIVYLLFLSIKLLFTSGISVDSQGPWFQFTRDGFKQLNVIVFVFTCHQNLLHIKADARDQSEKFINRVLNSCIIVSGSIYTIFSMASYLVFGSQIDPNILNNYSKGFMADLAKWLYVAMVVFSFPLMVAPATTAITNLMPLHINKTTSTLIVIFSSLLLSLFIKDLSVISAWIGVLASVPICYLLPGYLHYRFFNDDPSTDKNFKINSAISVIMCLFGLFLIIGFILI